MKALLSISVLGLTLTMACSVLAQGPKLRIERSAGALRLELLGEPGAQYQLEQNSEPGAPAGWQFLLGMTLTNRSNSWLDPQAATAPGRFYRALRLDPGAGAAVPANFRLLDQHGTSRELYYQSFQHAIVLVFVDMACPELGQAAARLRVLQEQFQAQGCVFWMVNSNQLLTRSNVVARADALGLDWPVLYDRAGLVSRAYAVTSSPEIVVINAATWEIAYRGGIDDRIGLSTTPPSQTYLANALAELLAKAPVPITRTVTVGCSRPAETAPVPSFATDIAPLLRANCVQCHSPGNIAPWSMTNHAIVQTYGPLIKDRVLTQTMPPWHADPEFGTFSNDVSLNPTDVTKLVRWLDAGAPRGDGPDPLADAPAPPATYPAAWPVELGAPDYVFSIPSQSIPATGNVDYRYLEVKTTISSNTWLRAAVVKPGNTKVVHHCLVFLGNRLEVFLANSGGLAGYFAGYVPGMRPGQYPEGTGKFLPKGQVVTFQMHYTTSGATQTDRTEIGLYTMPAAPAMPLLTKSAFSIDLTIPPGEREYENGAQFIPSATRDVLLYEMSPHMHLRGARFQYEAVYPNGTAEVLLSVPMYLFHWQTLYRLATPKRLPAGTMIRCRGAFDNSAQNMHNPDPTQLVRFGEQTDDEMFIGYMNYSEVP